MTQFSIAEKRLCKSLLMEIAAGRACIDKMEDQIIGCVEKAAGNRRPFGVQIVPKRNLT